MSHTGQWTSKTKGGRIAASAVSIGEINALQALAQENKQNGLCRPTGVRGFNGVVSFQGI
jgi:hypothetical protein